MYGLKEIIVVVLLLWFWPFLVLLSIAGYFRTPRATIIKAGSHVQDRVSRCLSAKKFDPFPLFCLPIVHGHLQTLSLLLRRCNRQWYDMRTTLVTDDKAVLGLWSYNGRHAPDAPVVVFFLGLTGDAGSSYAIPMIERLKSSHRIVLCCSRGCGDSSVGLTRPYNGRDTTDQLLVMTTVHKQHPNAKSFYAVGFSLGSNILVNCLADHSDRLSFVTAACCIGSPWNFQRSSKMLETGVSRLIFSSALANDLISYFERNKKQICAFGLLDESCHQKVRRLDSVRAFDALVTAPVSKYKDENAYYADASSDQRVGLVRTPLLCVSALDDPVVDSRGMPLYTCENPKVAFVLAETGGHLGFTEFSWDFLRASWIDRVVEEWFTQFK